ncbi:MAG: SIR2 family protein [Candidatus Levybacteria bacterium]|nr:SIR2 family protein [Candidatus Levybacteria bacterium]
MAKKLAIILGAGASHSLNPDPKALDNQGYRPPLAADIFRGNAEFRGILNKYPLAEVLASDIDRKIRQNKEGVGLEQILKEYESSLKSGKDSLITRNFLQIPLYLNELFGEIAVHFTKQPDEYNNLVTLALDKVDDVLFLTLNYDTLLEIPLARNFGIDFSNETDYISQQGWSLVKLHGSTNWYRAFPQQVQTLGDVEYFQILKTSPLPLPLQKTFVFSKIFEHAKKFDGQTPVYPAVTVPVDGKYDINCPESHETRAKEFLADCTNYLIIGTSGKDQDLLDLLKNNAKGGKTLVVGREEASTNNTRENFMLAVPQLQNNFDAYFHQRGFSQFVDGGKLDTFLDNLI